MATGNRTDWIQTRSGRKVFPLELDPSQIDLGDVVHALSMQCRFAGHASQHWSVAQHALVVGDIARDLVPDDPVVECWALLHDASEAYLVDIPRPLKRHPSFAFYREAEAAAMRVITAAFGLPSDEPPAVAIADLRALAAEAEQFMSPVHPEWTLPHPEHRVADRARVDLHRTLTPAAAAEALQRRVEVLRRTFDR